MKKRDVAYLIFAGIFVLLFVGLINAECPENQIIMKLYQETNSHGALWNDINYNIDICYNDIFNDGRIYDSSSHSCTNDNAVLWLSSPTNAHASVTEDDAYGIYNTPVCFGDLVCRKVETSDCASDEKIVVKLSSITNAHIGDASSNYPIKICCRHNAPAGEVNWANMMNNPIDSAENGDSVKLFINKESIKNKEIKYTIRKKGEPSWNPYNWIDHTIAQFDNIGYAFWKINVTNAGTYYFEAEILSTGEKISSKNVSFGEIEISMTPDDAYPKIGLKNPVYNSNYILRSNGLTNSILFEPIIYDEDDDINMTLSFGDENTTSFSNCLTTTNCSINHVYKSSGTKSIKVVVQEMTRSLYAKNCTRIFVFKEGVGLFSIIDSPDCYNQPDIDAGLLDISGASSYVSECSASQPTCNSFAFASGKSCYSIAESANPIPNIYCYKKAEAYDSDTGECDDKFTFNWAFDDGADNEHNNCSSFKKLFFDRGEHIINLRLVYNY